MKYLTSLLAAVVIITGCTQTVESALLEVGAFTKIYDPSVGENEQWYINDHSFTVGPDGKWHLFGITHAEPASPVDEDNFAHATASKLTQTPWQKEPFALSVDESAGETHLWAPHVIFYEGLYYMFYCAGGPANSKYRIHLATSKDLYNWQRHPANPMVVDGYDARDPYILRLDDKWVMYYTATSEPQGGNHVVCARTSDDLIHWSGRRIVFVDPSVGTYGGPTESPTVVRRGKYYYLFIGPRDGYRTTCVYRSTDPFKWAIAQEVARINSHAAEVIRDFDGKWYVSHCGWGQGGVYLAPLKWNDGVDDNDTSLPVPQKIYPIAPNKIVSAGNFVRIYDPSTSDQKWWINDHCFVRGKDGTWHMYGITNEKPEDYPGDSQLGIFLAHATASKLTQIPWQKEQFALSVDITCGEVHLWAPHVILHEGLYYMYYCAGDADHTKYKIHLATSKDLYSWKRHPANPMVVDGYDARDPFILRLDDKWVMYYTATSEPQGGNHIVAAVTSSDLIHWSDKRIVFTDTGKGTWGGNTESPFVIRRGSFYYLFIGPGDDYVTTKVYRSTDPFYWSIEQEVAVIKAHAAEIIRDIDGKWYISHCGLGQNGLYLAPLYWNDGIDDNDTSLSIP